jgi:hypothetical protein
MIYFKKKVFSRKLYNIKPNIENKMLIYGLKWKCLCVVHQPTETDPTQKRIIAVSIKKNFLLLYLVLSYYTPHQIKFYKLLKYH